MLVIPLVVAVMAMLVVMLVIRMMVVVVLVMSLALSVLSVFGLYEHCQHIDRSTTTRLMHSSAYYNLGLLQPRFIAILTHPCTLTTPHSVNHTGEVAFVLSMVGTAFTPEPQNQPAGVVALAALSGLTLAIHNANIYSLCEGWWWWVWLSHSYM